MRRYRNALILLGLFIVLLAVVLLTQTNTSNTVSTASATATPDPKAQQLQIINLVTADAPTRIEVKQTDPAKSVAIKYENSKWFSDAPNPVELDTITVAGIVGQFTTLKGTALVTDKGDNLPNYGLDKPSLMINLNSPTQGIKTIDVGQLNPATGSYYVKLENDPRVWTVPSTTIDQPKGWLDKLPVLPPTPTPFPSVALSPLPTLAPSGTPGTPGAATTPSATTPVATTTTAAATTAPATTAAATTAVPAPSPTP